jgi:hypothetical protein
MADRTARFNNWFQIVSNIAIIVGLGLVIYALNQSKQIAYVQMVDDTFSRMTSRNLTMMGEDPRDALAKAALRPADLTEKDVVTLDAFYWEVVVGWLNYKRTSEISGIDRGWRNAIAEEARRVFTTEPGRRWLRAWSAAPDARLRKGVSEFALQAVNERRDSHYKSVYELLLAKY